MDLNSGVSLGQFCLAVGLLIAGWGVSWGSLLQRVKTVETEMASLKDLPIQMAEVKVMVANLTEHLKDLNSSIRWMREPAPPYRPRTSKEGDE